MTAHPSLTSEPSIFDLVEPVQGFSEPVEAPKALLEASENSRALHMLAARPSVDQYKGPLVTALGSCTIRRLADKPYLQLQLNFPATAGELAVYHDGQLVDRAELVEGWQHSAVELKGVPTPAQITLVFRNAAGEILNTVRVRSIFLSDSWGRGQRRRLKCSMPFDRTNVLQNGDVSMCMCHEWLKAGNVLGNNKQEGIGDVWNGPQYQRVRRLFLEGRHEEVCRKEVCLILKGDLPVYEPEPDVVASINEGRTVLEHGPTHFQHDVDRGCNLECVMCREEKILPNEENVDRALRDVQEALDLGSVTNLTWSGAGEVFAMKKIVQLMETDIFSRRGVNLGFTTNLTFFNEKLWNRISHNHVMIVSVSADGCTPEIYNKIRIGADWDELVQNMRFLSRLKREGKVKILGWNYTLLRQNICDVGKAIAFAEELGFDHLRFIAQFGELSRTGGNMFEECDMDALDALYAEFERAKAFDKPWIWMSETGMRGRRYRTPEFCLDFAQHLHEHGGDPALLSEDLARYNGRKSLKIIRRLMNDIESGRIPRPARLPENNIRFLERFLEGSIGPVYSLQSLRRLRTRQAWDNAMDAHRVRKWVRKLIASAAPLPASRPHGDLKEGRTIPA